MRTDAHAAMVPSESGVWVCLSDWKRHIGEGVRGGMCVLRWYCLGGGGAFNCQEVGFWWFPEWGVADMCMCAEQ
jgi:hypothetical protein